MCGNRLRCGMRGNWYHVRCAVLHTKNADNAVDITACLLRQIASAGQLLRQCSGARVVSGEHLRKTEFLVERPEIGCSRDDIIMWIMGITAQPVFVLHLVPCLR